MSPTQKGVTGLIVLLLLMACLSRSSYRIVSTEEDPARMTIVVEVPATSTKEDMQGWANHMESLYKTKRKPLLINFYRADSNTDQVIGTYQGGSVRVSHR